MSGFSDLIEDVKMAFDRGMFFSRAINLDGHTLPEHQFLMLLLD